MRPMVIKDLLNCQFPSYEDISLIEGVNLEPLSFEKLVQLAALPYRDDHFLQLAFHVSYPSLRNYTDEGYLELIKLFRIELSKYSINNLVIRTNISSLLYTVREMKWIKGTEFLGSYGIYSIHFKFGFNEELMHRIVSRTAQYSLEICNIFDRLLIGVIQPDNSWQIGLINMGIYPVNTGKEYNTVKVTYLLLEPLDFVNIVAKRLKPSNVSFQEFVSYVRVKRSLEHF